MILVTVATPRTAYIYAYEALRSRILSGALAPGTPLVQANLARELGVSMTPIREALRNLATEGLIVISPHRGATVRELDIQDAQEIYRIRLQLEPMATSLAVLEASTDLLDRAEQLIDAMATATGTEWIALNLEFHRLLLPARSPRLLGILNSLLEAGTLYVGLAMAHRRAPAPDVEHRAILAAYRRRDPAGAAAAAAEHILTSLRSLEPGSDQSEPGATPAKPVG